MKKNINVTQPFLPPLDEFKNYLDEIWESKWLTNDGRMHQRLEKELAEFLNVPYVSLFGNGTLALITALQCLRITGEVITTPFSFVATTHALWWNGIKPVFADVDPIYGNLDPRKVEAAITPKTTAILPVHVYGHTCDVDVYKRIAEDYGLKIIYDAAHAFGVKHKGNSILNYGDLSVLSFHATKVFNTFEGGAIVCPNKVIKKRIDYLKNFGFKDETIVIGPGINAKMNEVQASMGLLQLKYVDSVQKKRSAIFKNYVRGLQEISGIRCLHPKNKESYNNAYFPIFINNEEYGISRDELYSKMKENNINCRRYFYPLISNLSTYNGLGSSDKENLVEANILAEQVVCLPIYPDLEYSDQMEIIRLLKYFAK